MLPVDVPLMDTDTLEGLIRAHRGGITLLSYNGRPEPLIGVYDKSLAQSIAPMLHEGSTAVWRLLDLVGYETLPAGGDGRIVANCNTPEEFAAVCAEGSKPCTDAK